ncbi:MAG: flagellar FliJ family protein [Candidatus Gastranaerophilales bacterium]|nr:flagellar FliJ family protein [Candidatus Gastranaerophilales bacterium]
MPFRYRLQKVLDFRIRKKEEQLQAVIKAKNEADRIQGLIDANNIEIAGVIKIMRTTSDFRMMDTYDKYLKHLYEKGEELQKQLQEALKKLEEEKQKLIECEKEVKVLEKHKEKALEVYKEEEKKAENKMLSEVAVQKYFERTKKRKEDEGENE